VHRVTIEKEGVFYQGRRYRSLSELARIITGCRAPLVCGYSCCKALATGPPRPQE
jgi:hypothetical protein